MSVRLKLSLTLILLSNGGQKAELA